MPQNLTLSALAAVVADLKSRLHNLRGLSWYYRISIMKTIGLLGVLYDRYVREPSGITLLLQ